MTDYEFREARAMNPIPARRRQFFSRRGLPGKLFGLALLLFIAWICWSWGFCRFYVGPGELAIITAKSGSPLPADQILAKPGQKGVLEDVLGEGRHFWNPISYDWIIAKAQFIEPGKIGVVTSLVGDKLPPDEILAEEGQQGIWKRVLGPGLYRMNPIGYRIEVVDATSIPVGFVGLVTNLSGKPSPTGEFAGADGKGMRKEVLQPGMYYINPYQYKVLVVEAGLNQVSLLGQSGGMVITKNIVDENNQMIQRLNQNVFEEQRRRRDEMQQMEATGVARHQPKPAPSGVFGTAPPAPDASYAEESDHFANDPGYLVRQAMNKTLPAGGRVQERARGRMPVMAKEVQPGFILNQFVNFPSRDGFDITLDMTVEFELKPENLASLYAVYGDLADVVSKTIMPKILSVSRQKGSANRAVDFIAGEGREKFQNELTEALQSALGEEKILIHGALIRNVNVPPQILEPLQVASLSKETDLTNREKQNTARKQAELNREMSLIKQFGEQVMQETTKIKAQIDAEQKKTVATIQADTIRQLAAIERETAEIRASKTVALGKADADSLLMVEGERAKGFGLKVKAFGDDQEGFMLYEFANSLSPDLKVNLIHAGEGTLWTDLSRASLGDLAGSKLLTDDRKKR